MREYIGRAVRRLTGTRQATIDTIEPGSIMVAPRRPIDRFDVGAITEVLDLATKIGAVLLDSGTGAIDTSSQIRFVASIYGVEDVDVDVTYNTIVVVARRGATLPPITTMQTVHYRSLDFTRLAAVDRLVRRIRDSAITPSTAHRIVDQIIAAKHPYPYWVSTFAWGLMASGISVLLGGDVVVAVLAWLTTVVTVTFNRRLNRIGTPIFFQQVAGGFIAVVPAALVYELGEKTGWQSLSITPSQVIAAGIVVLLSGLSLVGSVQDAITGAPITGVARFFELLLMTGGIIAGVGIGLRLMSSVGIYLPTELIRRNRGLRVRARQLCGASCAAHRVPGRSHRRRRRGSGVVPAGRRRHRRGTRRHLRRPRRRSAGPPRAGSAAGRRDRGHHSPASRSRRLPRPLRRAQRPDAHRTHLDGRGARRRLRTGRGRHARRVRRPHAATPPPARRTRLGAPPSRGTRRTTTLVRCPARRGLAVQPIASG